MLLLIREGWTIEVEPSTWSEILLFLTKCGWKPSAPVHHLLANDFTMTGDIAQSLAAAGQIVLDETMKDPLAAYSVIKFDMGKFAEIVDFASEGEFIISRKV